MVSPALFAGRSATTANRLTGERPCKKSKHHSARTPNTMPAPGEAQPHTEHSGPIARLTAPSSPGILPCRVSMNALAPDSPAKTIHAQRMGDTCMIRLSFCRTHGSPRLTRVLSRPANFRPIPGSHGDPRCSSPGDSNSTKPSPARSFQNFGTSGTRTLKSALRLTRR